MITYAQFIQDYPEFASASQAQFALYQNRATQHINSRWGDLSAGHDPASYTQADIGTELVIAHFLTRARIRAAAGASAGIAKGIVSAVSAGPGSVTYDTSQGLEEDAGHWNQTDYGREYVQMARLIGAGPTQAVPCMTVDPVTGPLPWVGIPFNGYGGT